MTAPLVTYAVDGRVGIVSLNRPEKLNAINAELKRALVEHFTEADRAPATSVVVLRGGGRSFCAGYDIAPNPARAARRGNALAWHESLSDDVALELTPDRLRPGPLSRRRLRVGDDVRPHDRCRRCRVRRARDPLLQRRPRPRQPFVIGLKRARELLYLGDSIDAPTALAYGMVNRVIPRAGLHAA